LLHETLFDQDLSELFSDLHINSQVPVVHGRYRAAHAERAQPDGTVLLSALVGHS
jgi:hypothetical protein